MSDADHDHVEELDSLLKSASARVTFDVGRNCTHPCTFCGKSPAERQVKAFALVTIGKYLDGQDLMRPVCAYCSTVRSHRWVIPQPQPGKVR